MTHHAAVFDVTGFFDGQLAAVVDFAGLMALQNPALVGAGFKAGKAACGRTEGALWALALKEGRLYLTVAGEVKQLVKETWPPVVWEASKYFAPIPPEGAVGPEIVDQIWSMFGAPALEGEQHVLH